MKKWRPRKVENLAQGHVASKRQSQHSSHRAGQHAAAPPEWEAAWCLGRHSRLGGGQAGVVPWTPLSFSSLTHSVKGKEVAALAVTRVLRESSLKEYEGKKKKHMKAVKAPSATLLFQFGDYPSRPSRFVWSLAGLGWGFPSSSPCGAVLCQSGVWSVRQAYVTWVGLLGTARLGGYEQEIWSPWVFKAHYLLTVIQWSIYFFAFILV